MILLLGGLHGVPRRLLRVAAADPAGSRRRGRAAAGSGDSLVEGTTNVTNLLGPYCGILIATLGPRT
jgi:hypothetical protein